MVTGCLQGHAERLKQWVSTGLGLLVLAIVLHFTDGKHPVYSFEIHTLSIYVICSYKYRKILKNMLPEHVS